MPETLSKPQRKSAMSPKELRALMDEYQVHDAEFARRVGVHKVTVYRWMSGKSAISSAYATHIRHRLEEAKNAEQVKE
jgi:DNA-binding transcriptional regulator YiaG